MFGTVVTNVKGGKGGGGGGYDGDEDSGKSILGEGGEMGQDIKRTFEVTVGFEQKDGDVKKGGN